VIVAEESSKPRLHVARRCPRARPQKHARRLGIRTEQERPRAGMAGCPIGLQAPFRRTLGVHLGFLAVPLGRHRRGSLHPWRDRNSLSLQGRSRWLLICTPGPSGPTWTRSSSAGTDSRTTGTTEPRGSG